MSTHTCQTPSDWGTLVDYWSGELPGHESSRLEQQLFECEACGAALDVVIALSTAIVRSAREARVNGTSTEAVLEQLGRDNLKVRRYRLEPGQTVHCTVAPDDDMVTAEFTADLSETPRVDAIIRQRFGTDVRETRLADVGVEGGRHVRWALPAAVIRALPAHRLDVSLVAVEPTRERLVAEYHLEHSPWQP